MSLLDDIMATLDVPPPPALTPPGCCRVGCKAAPADGHDFCAPCLAWLRFEVDVDPLAPPPPSPPHLDDDDAWWAGFCTGWV